MNINANIGISGKGETTIIKADGRKRVIPFTNTIESYFKNRILLGLFNGGNSTDFHPSTWAVTAYHNNVAYAKQTTVPAATTSVSGTNYLINYQGSFGGTDSAGGLNGVWSTTGSTNIYSVGLTSGGPGLQIHNSSNNRLIYVDQPITQTIDNNDTVNINYTLTLAKPSNFTTDAMEDIQSTIANTNTTGTANNMKLNKLQWRDLTGGTYYEITLDGVFDILNGSYGTSNGEWGYVSGSITTATGFKCSAGVAGMADMITTGTDNAGTAQPAPASFHFVNTQTTNTDFISHPGLTFGSPNWTNGDKMKVGYTISM